jgi:AAA15 family ATPase/GTPase
MRIKVKNLGVIDEADIILNPLTILIGPNNAGKTWLAASIGSILGPYGWLQYLEAYSTNKIQDIYPMLDTAIEQILDGGDATIDLVQFVEQYGETYLNNVARLAKQWMRTFMGTALVDFVHLDFHINLSEEEKEKAKVEVAKYAMNRHFAVGRGKRNPQLNILKETGNPGMYIYTSTDDGTTVKTPRQAIRSFLARSVFEALYSVFFSDKSFFPTERTTYITYPFEVEEIRPEVSLGKEKPLRERRGKALNGPTSMFLSMIYDIHQMTLLERKEREEAAKNDIAINNYIRLAQLLEEIIGGTINLPDPEPGTQREIIFRVTDSIALEIPIASSMVKELSSLVLYLRYLAEEGDWLIIDEPEMNLHPEAQVKIMEFLTILVNAGLRVLITTHSPYMLDHLENLIRAAEYDEEDQKAIAGEFFLRRKDAFIARQDMSIYLVDHKKAENILQGDRINWGTFGDISDQVAKLHYQL